MPKIMEAWIYKQNTIQLMYETKNLREDTLKLKQNTGEN